MEKSKVREEQPNGVTVLPNSKTLRKNLVGAFMILIISLLMIEIILVPEVTRLFNSAMLSQNISVWIVLVGSLLLVTFLIAFPVFLVIQGFVYYRDARKLDRMGIRTKGLVIEKWADISEGTPVYHVCYKYLLDMDALQTVSERVFRHLECDQSIDVLHLEHAPQVSRMLLES